ncbi:MAG TPA: SMI1/KNR4 family protein [Candidatus Elarobacter sp.]|nr:SMI1/KNR4 family protein [Candidatus Elarobacter sp.]
MDVESCEQQLGRFLPESYRAFLSLHDGGFVGLETVLPGMTSTSGFRIFGAQQTTERTLALADDLEPFELPPAALDGLIVFADYGNSDICLFDATRPSGGEYPVLDGFHEAVGSWRELVIAVTFEDWLRRIFDAFIEREQRLEYWLESPLRG